MTALPERLAMEASESFPRMMEPHPDEIAAYAAAIREAIAAYARTVDDPKRAHLHYDECPFKPFQDDPDNGDHPECTCAVEHLGSYWKGQLVLERAARMTSVTAALDAAARVARAACDGLCECDRLGDGPHRMSCEAGIGDDIAAAIEALKDSR